MAKHWAKNQTGEDAKKASATGMWLQSLFQNSKNPIVFADINGNLQALNRSFEDLTGYSKDELIEQKTFMQITPKKYEAFEARLVRRVLETGVSVEFEKEYIRKDGRHVPILVNAFQVKNEEDEVIGTGAILKDLTKRKQTEKLIRESEYRFNKSQEVAHLGSWELDLVDNVLTWSDEEYKIFGLEPQEFGATYEAFLETVHPDDRKAVDDAYSGSIREGRDTYEIEHRVVRKHTGEIRIVHEKCQHFRDENGKIIRSVGMTDDITEQKQAQKEREQLLHDLGERVKELGCLYGIAKIVEIPDITREGILQKTVELIPPSWQYPDITCARISIDDQEFRTSNFEATKETSWRQSADIKLYGRVAGSVEVYYLEEKPPIDEGPFLKEERDLVEGIAERLGTIIERKEAEDQIENLARFPSENPNPVIRIARDGSILYANIASHSLLSDWGRDVGQLAPQYWRQQCREILSSHIVKKDIETQVGRQILAFTGAPVGDDYVNFYGLDITERKQIQELSNALNEINIAITSTLNIDEIIKRVIGEARKTMDSETALLTLRGNDQWVLKYIDGQLSESLIGARFTDDQASESALAARTGKLIVANDVSSDESLNNEFAKKYSIKSVMAVPLVIKEDILGTIVFLNHSKPKAFTTDQIDFSEKLAVSVSLAIQNAHNYQMTQKALTDAKGLHRVSTRITQSIELNDVLRTALVEVLIILDMKHGCIYLVDDAENLVIRAQSQLSQAFLEAKGTIAMGEGCAGRAAKTKEIFSPTNEQHDYICEDSKNLLGLDCQAAVPLLIRGKTIGVLELFAPIHKRLSGRERRVVSTIADQMATAVENARLYSEQQAIADTLQETFLTVPQEIEGLDFGHLYRSATEVAKVGGDFLDLIKIEEHKIALLVGDVSGKGLEAAKMTSMVKNTIHAHAHEGDSPAQILKKTNKLACRTIPPASFATAFLGIIDTKTGVLIYSNAGHPPPIVRRATGRSSFLTTGNGPIGALSEFEYNDHKARLKDDDVLFMYTDGLIEARHDTQFYGERRLQKAVMELTQIPPPQLPQAIFDKVAAFTNGKLVDDIAMVSVSLSPRGSRLDVRSP